MAMVSAPPGRAREREGVPRASVLLEAVSGRQVHLKGSVRQVSGPQERRRGRDSGLRGHPSVPQEPSRDSVLSGKGSQDRQDLRGSERWQQGLFRDPEAARDPDLSERSRGPGDLQGHPRGPGRRMLPRETVHLRAGVR